MEKGPSCGWPRASLPGKSWIFYDRRRREGFGYVCSLLLLSLDDGGELDDSGRHAFGGLSNLANSIGKAVDVSVDLL
jgi:hypothetical protein